MNSTIYDSPEEAIGHFFLGGVIFLTYFYAIYLSYAMHDYTNEKPIGEIDPSLCGTSVLLTDRNWTAQILRAKTLRVLRQS